MTKLFIFTFCFLLSVAALAQDVPNSRFSFDKPVDQMNFEKDTVDKSDRMKVWIINEDNADPVFVEMDTLSKDFFNFNPIFQKSIANNYLGNLGSPYQSMIYFDRPRDLDFGMADVYRAYLFLPEDFVYYNTKVPYTNVQYTSGGPKARREESLQVTFSRNINKDWNITAFGNLIYGRGRYDYQSTRHGNFSFITSYIKPRYQLHFVASENNLKNKENGGLSDDDYILDPSKYPNATNPEDFGTNFFDGVTSSLYNTNVHLKHKYNIGFEKPIMQEDTTTYKFIPVSSLVHTFDYINYIKLYRETGLQEYSQYPDPIIMNGQTDDRMSTKIIRNELGLYLNEGLNKYAIFGLGAYINNEVITVDNNPWRIFQPEMDTMGHQQAIDYFSGSSPSMEMDSNYFEYAKNYTPYRYANTKVGGTIYKRKGESFFYNLKAELYLQGFRAGDYKLYGDVKMRFNKLDSAIFSGSVEFGGRTPYYYQHQYHSNYYTFDNQLKKVNNQRFTGSLAWPKINASVNFNLENLFEYVYFDTLGTVLQAANVQVLGVTLSKDFIFGNWHWDNILAYQASSSPAIAVPTLAVYSNIYYQKMLFAVLKMQVGLDGRFHTSYHAPVYIPALGRFAQQDTKEIGNYPMLNAYVNFHLKRMRFFVQSYHVNSGFVLNNYFASPGYPYNPRMFKVGLSWNFYD